MKLAMVVRFRIIIVCLFLLVLTFLINSCNKKRNPVDVQDPYENEHEEEPQSPEEKAWTFLFYDNADSDNPDDPLDDFIDNVYSGENVNFLVLHDSLQGPSNMYYINENHNKVLLEAMGEVNMSSYAVLYDFLDYAKTNYPAEKVIISFCGQGYGWEGTCKDVTSSYDVLEMDEIQKALSDAGGVDLILFCGPAFMGNLESAYELRNCTEVYIGSEDLSSYNYWMDPMMDICGILHTNPQISNLQLGEEIIGIIEEHDNGQIGCDGDGTLTMSAVRTDRIVELKDAVEAMASAYLDKKDTFITFIDSVYDEISTFDNRFSDLYDLAEKLLGVEEDVGMETLLESVKQCLQNTVIAECHDPLLENVHGLTIYLPNKSNVRFNYQYRSQLFGLDFANASHWDELLIEYNDNSIEDTKSWTFMLYDDADFQDAFDPLGIFATEVRSSENINSVVLQDTENGPANMWYIDENHNTVLLQEMGEINMGLSTTLYDFINYAKTYFPAERYIISFYDHGSAWKGVCWDDTDGHDNLTMDEMQKAFTDAGGVDLVLFSAPCLMGAFESVYEIRNCTDLYIGSENFSGYCYWVDTMQDICTTLHDDPQITNHQLGELVIGSVWANKDQWEHWPDYLTMSAVRTDRIDPLKDAVEAVALAYLDAPDVFRSYIEDVYSTVSKFNNRYLDLYDLAEKLLTVEEDEGRRTKLEDVKQCLRDAVIAECHGTSFSNLHGLTIYCPDKFRVGFDELYRNINYGLDFSNDTHWDELLQGYIGKSELMSDTIAERPQNRGDGFVNY